MNPVISAFNKGFGNCIFVSRDPENIERTLMDRMNNSEVSFMPEIPSGINITSIDDLHDKLSLSLKDGDVEGVLSWRKSSTGTHYVLNGLG